MLLMMAAVLVLAFVLTVVLVLVLIVGVVPDRSTGPRPGKHLCRGRCRPPCQTLLTLLTVPTSRRR